MSTRDQSWELRLRCRVTTMSGWEPETDDVAQWLDEGGALELVAVESVTPVEAQ